MGEAPPSRLQLVDAWSSSGCGWWWLSLQTEMSEDLGLEDMRAKHVNGLQPEQLHEGRFTAAGDRQPAVAIPRGGAIGFMGAVAQSTLRFKCTTACCYMQGSGMQLQHIFPCHSASAGMTATGWERLAPLVQCCCAMPPSAEAAPAPGTMPAAGSLALLTLLTLPLCQSAAGTCTEMLEKTTSALTASGAQLIKATCIPNTATPFIVPFIKMIIECEILRCIKAMPVARR